jgi:PASTA domain/FG-GAP repeat
MDVRQLVRRVFAIGAICAAVVAIAPAAPRADRLAAGSRWSATAIPQAALKIAGKGFRVSALSSDGRIAVVGDTRAMYLFRASSRSSWGPISKPSARLRLPSWALGNLAAVATSSDGTTVLVAAGAVGNNRAAAYVFHVASPGAWRSSVAPTAKLTDAAERTGFGSGVALSDDGRTALVGERAGADVFHVAAADAWRSSSLPAARLVADAEGAAQGGLSIAVALSADGMTALIGATSIYSSVGAAYIFRAGAADAWVSTATPDAVLTDGLVGLFGDGFGRAVALAPDGMTALVGAPNLALPYSPAGAAYLFHVRRPDAWTSTADPGAVVDQHNRRDDGVIPGWSVALSEEGTALVGAPSVLDRPGAADVFHIASAISHARLSNAASPPTDLFGGAVGLSSDGTTALVSSVRGAFVFTRAGSRAALYCYVPYVKGQALPAANRAIEATHCRVGKATRASSARTRNRLVVSQSPQPGERLAKGGRIDLVLGEGRRP